MIPKIKTFSTLPDYRLYLLFDDGKKVIYDVKEDMALPGYDELKEITGLFEQAQLDESRTCVSWSDRVDLPSDILYEYGTAI